MSGRRLIVPYALFARLPVGYDDFVDAREESDHLTRRGSLKVRRFNEREVEIGAFVPNSERMKK